MSYIYQYMTLTNPDEGTLNAWGARGWRVAAVISGGANYPHHVIMEQVQA